MSLPASQQSASPPWLAALRRIPALAGVEDHELCKLAASVTETTLAEHTTLYEGGALGSEILLVLDGWAAITVHGEPVAVLGPGQFVQVRDRTQPSDSSRRIVAKTAMRVLVIPRDALDDFSTRVIP